MCRDPGGISRASQLKKKTHPSIRYFETTFQWKGTTISTTGSGSNGFVFSLDAATGALGWLQYFRASGTGYSYSSVCEQGLERRDTSAVTCI